jgi:undecaprenyl pyrophosphate synthase
MDELTHLNKYFISEEDYPALYTYVEDKIKNFDYETTQLNLPKIHLGIIPDGNRRWCKQNGMSCFEFRKMVQHMILRTYYHLITTPPPDLFHMVEELSIYVLSKDNMQRDDDTLQLIEDVMELFCDMLKIEENSVRLKFDVQGEIDLLPETLKLKIKTCIELSKGTFPIHLAIGYDPIEDSAIFLKQKRRQIDMVVRSGGQFRSSGFYPLQTLYSEWFYYDTLWPDMNLPIMYTALEQFLKRQRNFGK